LIQLVLSVSKNTALSVLEYVDHIFSESFLSAHPDVRLRMQFEDEFSYDSLLTVINHQVVQYHDSKLVAYEIIEPSLRLKTINATNFDRAISAYSKSKPKVLILLSHVLDSSVWQDKFISRDVVNSESVLTRLIRIPCKHLRL